jgi:four helix bundle protein
LKDFRDLKVWEKSHKLTLQIYAATREFPREERYSLTSQIRRAAGSIPANIAEGCGRDGDAGLSRYLRIAMGSSSELEYDLLLARDLSYFNEDTYQNLAGELIEIRKMLNAFIQRLTANR